MIENTVGYEIDNTKTSLRFEVNYKVTSVASVGALFRYINYSDNISDANDYTEPIIGLTLRSAF